MDAVENKKVKLRLVGVDGNAFVVLAVFRRAAVQQGWTKEEIDEVVKKAMSGSYEELLITIMDHCEDGGA